MDYEYAPLRLPPDVDKMTAAVRLTLQAEYAGWELDRLRLLRDGTRMVILRRPSFGGLMPGLSV